MKTSRLFAAVLVLAGSTAGFSQILTPPDTSAAAAGVSNAPRLTPEQLDQLLGPIALYPDALIALILPAATAPSDVVLAARYLNGGDSARVDEQPWDDSVRALAHYPDVVKWMDENLRWTQQLGEAFLDQPAEVMKSVQRLRAEARAAGTLVDTPQQQVVVESEVITIVPAQPDVIYVPYYDPEIVYVRRDRYPGPFLTFSIGYPTGFWLGYNVDWGHRRLWVVDRHDRERYWRDQRDWRRPVFPARPNVDRDSIRHAWTPPPAPRPARPGWTNPRTELVRPAPISRGTARTEERRENSAPRRDNSQPAPIPFTPISTPPVNTPPPPTNSPPRAFSRGNREAPREDRQPPREERAGERDRPRDNDRERDRSRDRNPAPAAAPSNPAPSNPAPSIVMPNHGRISLPPPPNVPAPAAAPAPSTPPAPPTQNWRQDRGPATPAPANPPAKPDDNNNRRGRRDRDNDGDK